MSVRYEPVVDKETGKQTGTFVFQVYTDVNGKTYESYFGCICLADLGSNGIGAVMYFCGPATADSEPNAVRGTNFWLLPRYPVDPWVAVAYYENYVQRHMCSEEA